MSWGAAAGAIAGGIIGTAGNLYGQQEAMRFNAKEAAKNREFQERMAKNAHQYAAEDMEKAGLNRILALGNQAATPSGSSASTSAMEYGTIASNAATAVEARRNMRAQNENLEVQNDLIKAEIEQKQAETHYTKNKSALITPVGSGIQEFEGEIKDAWKSVKSAFSGDTETAKKLRRYFYQRVAELEYHGGKTASSVKKAIEEFKNNPGKVIYDFTEKHRPDKKLKHKGNDEKPYQLPKITVHGDK